LGKGIKDRMPGNHSGWCFGYATDHQYSRNRVRVKLIRMVS